MNFAIPFFKNFKYLDQNVQLNINYKPKIKELDNFIQAYGTHRINLIISDFNYSKDIQIIQALREKYPNTELVMCMPRYEKTLEETLCQHNLPHYYNQFINTWEVFQGFLNLSVTDIIITGDLAFNVKIASEKAKEKNKALRCFCNIAQFEWKDTPSLKTFFIRPEDIQLYENYIDTIEFETNNVSVSNLNTLYEIYTKDKKWFGKLNELIIGFQGDADSRFIIPRFGEKRLDCGRRCLQGTYPVCQICDRIIQLGKTLKDNDIAIKIDNS